MSENKQIIDAYVDAASNNKGLKALSLKDKLEVLQKILSTKDVEDTNQYLAQLKDSGLIQAIEKGNRPVIGPMGDYIRRKPYLLVQGAPDAITDAAKGAVMGATTVLGSAAVMGAISALATKNPKLIAEAVMSAGKYLAPAMAIGATALPITRLGANIGNHLLYRDTIKDQLKVLKDIPENKDKNLYLSHKNKALLGIISSHMSSAHKVSPDRDKQESDKIKSKVLAHPLYSTALLP